MFFEVVGGFGDVNDDGRDSIEGTGARVYGKGLVPAGYFILTRVIEVVISGFVASSVGFGGL